MGTLSCWLSRFWVLLITSTWVGSFRWYIQLVWSHCEHLGSITSRRNTNHGSTKLAHMPPNPKKVRLGKIWVKCSFVRDLIRINYCAQAHPSRSKLISPDVAILFDGTKGVRSLLTENARGIRRYCISSRPARLIDFIRPNPIRGRTLYQGVIHEV